MITVFWMILMATGETHQFEFDGTIKECKQIAANRMKNNKKIQAGCYEIETYPGYLKGSFKVIIK